MVTVPPRRIGRDIGPDEKYRDGFWVQAILERGNPAGQSDEPFKYQRVFIRGSSADRLIQEPLDESDDPFRHHESSIEVEAAEAVECDYTTGPNVFSERDRLKTFGPWKQAYHVTPLDLARNGFLYRGPGDRVTCVFCRKIIYQWEEGDVVEEEHRRISPNCPFVNGERDHWNIAILSAEPDRLGDDDDGDDDDDDDDGNSRDVVQFNSQRYLAFQDTQLRKETFVNWHNISPFNPELLCEAGFLYTGKGEGVMCHQCGVLIHHHWEDGDNPWIKHAQSNPRCGFLLNRTLGSQTSDSSNGFKE